MNNWRRNNKRNNLLNQLPADKRLRSSLMPALDAAPSLTVGFPPLCSLASSHHPFTICTEENPPATAGGTDSSSPLHLFILSPFHPLALQSALQDLQ
jgi:hypothetical protein